MHPHFKKKVVSLVAATAALCLGVSGSAVAAAAPGAPGIGDPYFPQYGNGGYNVSHYDLTLDYKPASDFLAGTAKITAQATQDLSAFNLDFGLTIRSALVNGAPARVVANGTERTLVLAQPISKGSTINLVVKYFGNPGSVITNGYKPWVKTADGAIAIGQPEISVAWFPGNDHPLDKATYDFEIIVPKGVEALSNGRLGSHVTQANKEIWKWNSRQPMATYLAFMAIGQFDIFWTKTASGVPVITAYAAQTNPSINRAKLDLARTAEVTDWNESHWGPYPFESSGGIVPDANIGYALENQTRPIYDQDFWAGGPNMLVVVHEIAHQWFGDSVSVNGWQDIWLNEGFASFAEWQWMEDDGSVTAEELFRSYAAIPGTEDFWKSKIGDPGAEHIFDKAVYDRGAMTLQALRTKIGDEDFYSLMRIWPTQRKFGNVKTAQFIDLAERVSGKNLQEFFDVWLFQPRKPAATAAHGFPTNVTAKPSVAGEAARAELDRVHHSLHAKRG